MKVVKIALIIAAIIISIFLAMWLARKFGIIKSYNPAKWFGSWNFRYFKPEEFDSPAVASDTGDQYVKDGKQYLTGTGEKFMNQGFVGMLDKARIIINDEWNELNPSDKVVFAINNGYRTPQYNDYLVATNPNAVDDSPHKLGMAADISLSGYNSEQLEVIFDALDRVGFSRYGTGDSFMHVDNDDANRPSPAWWVYDGSASIQVSDYLPQYA